MKALFASICCFFCWLAVAFGWQPIVAVHDSELTRALATMPASGATPNVSGATTGFQWWVTNWNYFTIAQSVKESFRSDGTTYAVVGDSNILAGQLMDTDGTPKYPIVISLASEAISDQEVTALTNYVAAGGFLYMGSSSFTRTTNGTSRTDFAIASAMGLHMVNAALTNWDSDFTLTAISDHRLVTNIPSGTLFWEMPSSSDEISWPTADHLDGEAPDAQMPGLPHLIWQVQASSAAVLAVGDGNLPYLTVNQFGKGYVIYDASMEPLLGHGSWAPGMYAYDILRSAVEWAYQSARLPVVRLDAWPFAYNAAVMFRHDLEAIPARISLIKSAADFEHTNGASGDFYFCTGSLRLDMPGESNSVITSLQQAISLDGATIGPHNGGLTNINIYVPPLPVIEDPTTLNTLVSEGWLTSYYPYTYPVLAPLQTNGFSYDYWHWGPDEVLNTTPLPAGYSSGQQYAFTSLSNSFQDIAAWQLTNGTPRAWCSPYFNATREPSYQVEQALNVKITGDDKLTPFPHWIFSSQTSGKYYSILSLPVSDWYVGPQVSQSMESGHTDQTIEAMVDFYYNLGGLINLYCHTSPLGSGPDADLDNTYITYSLSKSRVWSTNAAGIYSWWLQRSNVQVSASFSTNSSPPKTTVQVSGSTNANMTVDLVVPFSSYAAIQVTTNGVAAGASVYRTNGQTIRLLVGNSVTNAVVSYFTSPQAQGDVYSVNSGSPLTVSTPGVLANDTVGFGQTMSAVLVSGPSNGTLTFNTNGSFTYTPTNGYTGMDRFSYEAVSDSLTSSVANVAISVDSSGELAYDNFSRPAGSGNSIFPWVDDTGTWGITNGVMIGTSPQNSYGYAYYSGASWTDFSVQASIQFSTTSAWGGGISGRLDPNNGAQYEAWIYPENSAAGPGNGTPVLQMIKYRDWQDYTMIGSPLTLPAVGTGTHTVQLSFSGNSISVHFDGALLTNITDNGTIDGQPAYTSGTIGLNMWTEPPTSYTMSVDNVIVSGLSTVANNDAYMTTTNKTLNVSAPGVLANDSGGVGSLSALLVSNPGHGTLTLTNNGGFQYIPSHNFNGTDTFTYQATDGQTTSSVATVTITVTAGVVATPNTYNVEESTTYNVSAPGILANDSGGIGPLSALLVANPTHGTLTLTNNGGFSYTPTFGFVGTDGFTYQATDGNTTSSVTTVTLDVLDPPAVTNDIYVTSPGAALNVIAPGVLANDAGNNLSAILASGPLFGSFSLGSDGSFSYQSTNNFFGVDDFTYEASDGQNTSSPAVAAIEVVPIGKLFVDDFTHDQLWPWIAESGTWTNGDDLMSGTNPPTSYGHVYLTNNWTDYIVQAQIRFTDTNGWGGGIGGRLSDPVTGTHYAAWVYPEGSAFGGPKLLLEKYASWTDVGWQILAQTSLSAVGTNWNTLGLAFQGTNLFVYYNGTQIIATNDNSTYPVGNPAPYTNGGICANMWEQPPVVYTMSVSNVTVSALAANNSYSMSAGTTLSVAAPGPLGNDTPVYGSPLTMTAGSTPAHGIMTLTNNGGFTYTPTNDYVGTDVFTYQAVSGSTVLGSATVTITVNPVHNGPTLPNQANRTNAELVTLTVTNTAVDTDIPPTTLNYTLTGPTGATISNNGVITWTPGFTQAPSTNVLTTVVTDNGSPALSATNSFTVVVFTVNQAPTLTLASNNVIRLENGGGVTVSNFASAVPGPANELSQSITNYAILSISNAQMFASGPTIDTNGTLTFLTANTSNGVASVKIQAQDNGGTANGGTNGSVAQTFTITVLSVDQPPILTLASNNVSSLENGSAVSLPNFASATPGQAGLTVTNFVILSVSSATLFSAGPAISSSGTLSYTSANTSNGVASVTLQARDTGTPANGGTNGSVAQTFTITVLLVNQPPTMNLASNNVTTVENAGAVSVPNFAALTTGPANEASQSITNVAILSISNTTLFASGPTMTTNGMLSFTPAATSNGVASVTVQAQDNGGTANGGTNGSVAQTFTITVLPVNQPPTMNLVSNNVITVENAGAISLPNFAALATGPANEASQSITNVAILSISNATLFASGPTITTNGTLNFTAAATSNGVASMTVQAQDNGGTANGGTNGSVAQTFTITVLPVNQPPILTLASNNVTTLENGGGVTVSNFASAVPGPANELSQNITNYAILSTSNAQMFATGPSIDTNGTLTFLAANTSNGVASVTIQAQDNGGTANGGTNGSVAQTFTITILPVAQPPILTLASNNVTSLENGGAVSVPNFASAVPGQAGLSVTNFAILSVSNAQMFVSGPTISAGGTLSYTTANTSNGVASVTVQAQDTGSSANGGTNGSVAQTFTITVLSVAQPPILTLASNNVTSLENGGAVSVPNFASALPGQAGLSVTNFAILSVSNATLFSVAPTISVGGTLSYTSANTSNGVASVTVQAQDTGTPANGGTNGSVAQTFTITVLPVNQAPTLNLSTNNVATLENGGGVTVSNFASALPGQAGLSVTNFAVLSVSNAQMFATGPAIDTNGTLTFLSANTSNGVASVTVQAQDNGGTANGGTNGSVAQTFTITVLPVAQPPVLTLASNNVTSLENAGAVSVPNFASAVPGQAGLSVTNFAILSMSNPTLFSVTPAISAGGTLSYTSANTSNGVASVTVQAQDTGTSANGGTNGSPAQTFTITVLPVAQPPVLTLASNNVTSLENAGAVSVPNFASAVPGQAGLSVTNFAILSVSNPQIFASGPAISAGGTLSYTTASTSNGVASVTVQAQDTGSSANGGTNGSVVQTFTITVLPVNQPPLLTLASNNVITLENGGGMTISNFASAVPGPANELGQSITNYAILSISNAQIFATGPAIDTNGTLTFLTASTSNGVASVTVQAQDNGGTANGGTNGSVAQTFTITVLSVAQPPILTLASNNVTSLENAGAVSVANFASALPGQAGLSVTGFTILSVSNAQMFATGPAISAGGTLSYTSANTSNGVASVTVQAQDTGSSANGGTNGSVAQTFTITVLPVAQPPVLTLASNNVTSLENAGTVGVINFASAVPGQAGLSVTNFAILSVSNATLFSVAPTISAGGTLSYTSANTSNGVASVTVQAQDTGTSANGGTNGSVAQTFTITVLPVAQPPLLTLASNNVTSLENAGAVGVVNFASAVPGQAGLSVTNFAILSVSNAQMFASGPAISAGGTLTYTSASTSNGVASVTVQAQDTGTSANGGTNGSVAQTFAIMVLSVAQPPILTLASNSVTSLENAGFVSVANFASALPGQAGLSVTNFAILSVSNATLFSVAPTISAGGTLSYTSANTSNGVASVTVQAQDTGSPANGGTNGSVAQTFTITVLSVAQPPVLTLASNNVTSLENAGAVNVPNFASAVPGQAGLSVTNFAILNVSNAQMFAVGPAISASGTLSYTTANTSNGVASVTVQAQDTGTSANGGTNGSVAQTFTITVLPVSQAPTLSLSMNNVVTLENGGGVTLSNFASALPGQAGLSVTNIAILSVSNAQMFAVSPAITTNGTLTFTAATYSNGVASVTVQAQDNGGTSNGGTNGSVAQTFTITVLPVNQPPILTLASNNVTILENGGGMTVSNFASAVPGPANELGQSITNYAILSISNAQMFASGPSIDTNGTLTFLTANTSNGVASVTIQAQDNGGTANGGTNGSVAQTFTITVLPVAQPPILTLASNNVISLENAGAVSVANFASAVPGQSGLSVTNFAILSVSNAQMFAAGPTISASGTLSYTTANTSNGVASVTVQALDTGSSANGGTNGSVAQTFTITVLTVAQPPILTLASNNVTSLENGGARAVPNFASAIPGQAGLSVTNFAILSVSNATLFSVTPTISLAGTLSYTSATTSNGVASVTVQTQDTGSSANGGTNGSVVQTFTITVLPVAQPPILTLASNNVISLENGGAMSVPNFASAVPGQAGLSVTNFMILSVSNAQIFISGPTISVGGTLSYTTASTSNGVASVTVQAQDTGSAANGGTNGSVAQTFTITVLTVDQPPVLTLASNNVTSLENGSAVSLPNFASAIPGQAGLSVTNFAILSVSNAQMFASGPAISSSGTLTYTTAGTSNGVAHVTVQALDNGTLANGGTNGSVAQTFTITVLPVNQPPTLNLTSNNAVTLENAGAVSLPNFAIMTTGPANEASQSITNVAILSISNAAIFALDPTISTSGTLSFTPAANSNGVASVTVQAQDNGGTANGGTNGSLAQTFTITVVPVSYPPLLPAQPNQTIGAGTQLIVTNTATDQTIPAPKLTYVLTGPVNAAISTNGVISWTPTALQASSTNVFTTVVSDNSLPPLSATNSFTVTVTNLGYIFKITSVTLSNGIATVTWNSLPGQDYRVQYNTNLSSTNWTDVAPDVVATNSSTSLTNGLNGADMKIYRVEQAPPALPQPQIESISITNSVVAVTWTSVSGHYYRLQFVNSLTSTNWTDILPEVLAIGPASSTTTPAASSQNFYRVWLHQ